MAKKFRFIRSNMTWDSNGHVINAVLCRAGETGSPSLLHENGGPYSLHERAAYLRYYLETNGAIIWVLMDRLSSRGNLRISEINELLQDIFCEVYESYLRFVEDYRSRIRIKSRLTRLRREGYKASTLPHKTRPHIRPLIDLGILVDSDSSNPSIAGAERSGKSTPCLFLQRFDSIESMERSFTEEKYFGAVADLLIDQPNSFEANPLLKAVEASLLIGYDWMKSKTTALTYVNALCDWVCIDLLASYGLVLERDDIRNHIRRLQRDGKARYDLDFRGHPAFVSLQY